MKKVLIGVVILSSLVFSEENKVFSLNPPKFKNDCSPTSMSFVLYKETKCQDKVLSMFKPKCIELTIRSILELDTKEAKYYSHDEAIAYYKKQNKKNNTDNNTIN